MIKAKFLRKIELVILIVLTCFICAAFFILFGFILRLNPNVVHPTNGLGGLTFSIYVIAIISLYLTKNSRSLIK